MDYDYVYYLKPENLKALTYKCIEHHFSRARGHIVTLQPGHWLFAHAGLRRGLPLISKLVIDSILTEYREVRWNGRVFRIVDIDKRHPVRIYYSDCGDNNGVQA